MIATATTVVALIVSIIGGPAVATDTTVRMGPQITVADPPDPLYAPEGLSACDEMSWYREAVGLPARFDGIGHRESRCLNRESVRTWCCVGWWQLWVGLHLDDHRLAPRYAECGITSYRDVNSDTPADKLAQACAAKALYDVNGTNPWKATR